MIIWRKMIEKGVYRHYKKGNEYFVIGEALHTETNEVLVLYKSISLNEESDVVYARPKEMFEGMVETKNGLVRRFEKVKR
jgi:cyclomaltodextrinase